MDDICLRAGCSKGGLYHHFSTKPAVLREVVRHLGRQGGLGQPLEALAAATGLQEAMLGRLLVDIWAETARSPELQAQLAALTPQRSPEERIQQAGAILEAALRSAAHELTSTERDSEQAA